MNVFQISKVYDKIRTKNTFEYIRNWNDWTLNPKDLFVFSSELTSEFHGYITRMWLCVAFHFFPLFYVLNLLLADNCYSNESDDNNFFFFFVSYRSTKKAIILNTVEKLLVRKHRLQLIFFFLLLLCNCSQLACIQSNDEPDFIFWFITSNSVFIFLIWNLNSFIKFNSSVFVNYHVFWRKITKSISQE